MSTLVWHHYLFFFYSFNPLFYQSGSTVYVSPPAFLVLWSITSGGHSLAEGFFLRVLKQQLCQRMRSPCWTRTCSRIPLQQETQQNGKQEETQKRQQQDEPQLGVNWSPWSTDVLFVSVVGLRRSCRQIRNHTLTLTGSLCLCSKVRIVAVLRGS